MEKSRPDIRIRLAVADDASSIASVLSQAFAEYETLYTHEGFTATTPNAEQILDRLNEGLIWVALHDETIVGTVSVIPKNGSLYIRGMAILPAARGQRIGELLLKQIEDFAASRGYRRLFLSTTPFLARAIRLYEHFGFRRSDEGPHDLFGTPLLTMEKMMENSQVVDASAEKRRVAVADAMALLPTPEGESSTAVLEHGSLQVKIYAPRDVDPQQPHTRDEAYIVIQGSGEFVINDSRQPFGAGDFLFAPAGIEHRFVNFTDDFFTWVIFYGPEGGEANAT